LLCAELAAPSEKLSSSPPIASGRMPAISSYIFNGFQRCDRNPHPRNQMHAMQSAQFQLHAQIEEQHWWFVARRQIVNTIVNTVLPPSPTTTIVDVGCGTGANLAGLAAQYDCVGIDSSAQAIDLARGRFPQVRFIHGRAPSDLEGIIQRARMVLLMDVLEHVADDFQLFSELLAATQPGTYFLLTVPANLSLWSEHDRTFGHYRRYDLERFAQIWQGLPVRALFTSHFNTRLYPIVRALRAWSRWRGGAGGLAGADFMQPNPLGNKALTRCFAGERHRLARLAQGELLKPYSFGVSLMALVQRQEGTIEPRRKPRFVAGDQHDPAAEPVTADA
jgi:SAM-dependent methyltransferase